jgi:hypothetical protein
MKVTTFSNIAKDGAKCNIIKDVGPNIRNISTKIERKTTLSTIDTSQNIIKSQMRCFRTKSASRTPAGASTQQQEVKETEKESREEIKSGDYVEWGSGSSVTRGIVIRKLTPNELAMRRRSRHGGGMGTITIINSTCFEFVQFFFPIFFNV